MDLIPARDHDWAMKAGWRYRIAGVLGTLAITVGAIVLAYEPGIRTLLDLIPVVGGLPDESAVGMELLIEAAVAGIVVLATVVPLYKPRPRRILDTWMLSVRRVSIALLALATIGYFDYSYRLPRRTLLVVGVLLLVILPLYFVAIRRRPSEGDRTIIIGDNPQTMADILAAVDGDVLGYVSPPSPFIGDEIVEEATPQVADGGVATQLDELPSLGGLSRLDEVLVDYDVDTAVLAFDQTDRAEFFGALDTCYDHGVRAMVHRDHADAVLTSGSAGGDLVQIDLEPWDWQDHVFKRVFDVVFASVGLLVLSPMMLVIAIAITAEDGGPILYSQERTAAFGDTFTISKFRSMVPNAEDVSGAKLSDEDDGDVDPRVTRVGRVLRQTHLDEIPQLWAILVGDMSVVGPRPERPGLDEDMEMTAAEWRSRWFVKPGLTGLAQIRGATGFHPEEKLRYDVEYIRKQGFWFDLKIVIRQVWMVLTDLGSAV